MSDQERTNKRTAVYSQWHRMECIVRYVRNPDVAKALGMIDLDHVVWCEYVRGKSEPLALIETTADWDGQKSARVLTRIGERADLPTFCVKYRESHLRRNPIAPECPDIDAFRVYSMYPEKWFREMDPETFALFLTQLRENAGRKVLRQCGLQLAE